MRRLIAVHAYFFARPVYENCGSMSVAVRLDPALWTRIKNKWLRSGTGKWNARKAMLAVQEYKRLGGRYAGPRSLANSLKKWAREDWGYVDGNPAGRYLPAAVRAALTPAEKRRELALKRGRAGEWVPYSTSVNEKMRRAGIYRRATAPPRARATPRARARATAPPRARARATAPPRARATAPPRARARARATAPPRARAQRRV